MPGFFLPAKIAYIYKYQSSVAIGKQQAAFFDESFRYSRCHPSQVLTLLCFIFCIAAYMKSQSSRQRTAK